MTPALDLFNKLSKAVTDKPSEILRMVRTKYPDFVIPAADVNAAETRLLFDEIKEFIERKGITPTRFGVLCSDPTLIPDLQTGRVLKPGTRDRLRQLMQLHARTDLRPIRQRLVVVDPVLDAPKPSEQTTAERDNERFLARLLPARLAYLERQGLISRKGSAGL